MTSLPPPQHVSEIVLGVFLCSGLGEGHGLEGTFLSFPEGHVPKSHGLALTEHSIWHQTVAIRKRQKLHKWTKPNGGFAKAPKQEVSHFAQPHGLEHQVLAGCPLQPQEPQRACTYLCGWHICRGWARQRVLVHMGSSSGWLDTGWDGD